MCRPCTMPVTFVLRNYSLTHGAKFTLRLTPPDRSVLYSPSWVAFRFYSSSSAAHVTRQRLFSPFMGWQADAQRVFEAPRARHVRDAAAHPAPGHVHARRVGAGGRGARHVLAVRHRRSVAPACAPLSRQANRRVGPGSGYCRRPIFVVTVYLQLCNALPAAYAWHSGRHVFRRPAVPRTIGYSREQDEEGQYIRSYVYHIVRKIRRL
jgi:hypothetical protein